MSASFHSIASFIDGEAAVKPSTQKIKGLSVSSRIVGELGVGASNDEIRSWRWAKAAEVATLTNEEQLPVDLINQMYEHRLFVRPCPVTPRHGFADSRIVTSVDDLVSLAVEALELDPEAEMLFTRFLAPRASFILTPQGLSWGKGNAGATSGKSQMLYGPYAVPNSKNYEILTKAGISAPDTFFIEGVQDRNTQGMEIVQVRGGPAIEAAVDYVPKAMEVKRILVCTPETDLVRWEKEIASAKGETGVVVYAQDMGLSSHFCVHAVVNSVACVTSKQPKVGDKLAKSKTPEFKAADWKRLATYMAQADQLMAGTSGHRDRRHRMALLGLSALHCVGTPAPATDAQLRFLATGAVAHAKLIAAACFGEMRHCLNTKTPSDGQRTIPLYDAFDWCNEHSSGSSRTYQFDRAVRADTEVLADAMYALAVSFKERYWSGSFGGEAWAKIATGAGLMLRAIEAFRKKPSKETWAKVVEPWNNVIHLEHNGGDGALAKFNVGKVYFDKAAAFPLASLLRAGANTIQGVIFQDPSPSALKTAMVTRESEHPGRPPEYGTTIRAAGWVRPEPTYLGTGRTWSVRKENWDAAKHIEFPETWRDEWDRQPGMRFKTSTGSFDQPAIVTTKLVEEAPKGGRRYIDSVRAVEKVLGVEEPAAFAVEYVVSVELPVLGLQHEIEKTLSEAA